MPPLRRRAGPSLPLRTARLIRAAAIIVGAQLLLAPGCPEGHDAPRDGTLDVGGAFPDQHIPVNVSGDCEEMGTGYVFGPENEPVPISPFPLRPMNASH